MTETKKKLGGARPGSGRKPRTEDKKALIAYLRPEQYWRIRRVAAMEDKSISGVAGEAIESYLNDKLTEK